MRTRISSAVELVDDQRAPQPNRATPPGEAKPGHVSATGQATQVEELERLRAEVQRIRDEGRHSMTAWARKLGGRHEQRPYSLDYVERIFQNLSEIHGDRRFGDEPAIVTGMARYHGQAVLVVGHQKGRDINQRQYRNFGYAQPEGYRKALRAMKLA